MTEDQEKPEVPEFPETAECANHKPQPQPPDGKVRCPNCKAGGDHDQPYTFGYRPTANHPFPFNANQLARLWLLQGKVKRENEEEAA